MVQQESGQGTPNAHICGLVAVEGLHRGGHLLAQHTQLLLDQTPVGRTERTVCVPAIKEVEK